MGRRAPCAGQGLVLTGGSVLALSSTFGALSLTLGLIAGPLAKLQLGLGLLTGAVALVVLSGLCLRWHCA